jgi:hypothetical protein
MSHILGPKLAKVDCSRCSALWITTIPPFNDHSRMVTPCSRSTRPTYHLLSCSTWATRSVSDKEELMLRDPVRDLIVLLLLLDLLVFLARGSAI